MKYTMNEKLLRYLQQQIRTADDRILKYIKGFNNEKYPRRFMVDEMIEHIDAFLNKTSNNRMIIIPGSRGVGKTTLMAQLFEKYREQVRNILFLSVDDANNLFDVGISDLMLAYEEILGDNLESIKKPTIIFLDEVQADSRWATTLKTLFDKTSNVFFICTGSSALILETTPSLARRVIFKRMPPLSFIEFEMIKNKIKPISGLKDKIMDSIYFSKNEEEVFNNLNNLKKEVNTYFSKVNRKDVKKYLSYGTLPFSLSMPNEMAAYDAILMLVDKIITHDMSILGNFNQETLMAAKKILFAIAENDTTSLYVLEKNIGINRLTIASVFDAFEKAGVIIKVRAYGSNMSVAKKPNKYLFASPAIRMSFFNFTANENTYLTRQGKLFEDSVASHLYREFILKNRGFLRYDSKEGGADFILQILNNKQIIIEVGIGKKNARQVLKSAKRIRSDYNIVISDSVLNFDKETNIVFVPLDYYFLM